MSSYIFKTLLHRQIDNFIDTYGQDSNGLFKDKEGRLIHSGEYGMYREECFKRLLQVILDKDYAVSDGFVINSDDKVSTQCDVLVHKYNSKPLIDGSYAKLFLGSLEQSIKNCIKYDYDFGDYLGITSSTIRQKET